MLDPNPASYDGPYDSVFRLRSYPPCSVDLRSYLDIELHLCACPCLLAKIPDPKLPRTLPTLASFSLPAIKASVNKVLGRHLPMYLIDAHPASVFAAWIDWGWAEGGCALGLFGMQLHSPHFVGTTLLSCYSLPRCPQVRKFTMFKVQFPGL
jgi:hypothetical protein